MYKFIYLLYNMPIDPYVLSWELICGAALIWTWYILLLTELIVDSDRINKSDSNY